MYNHNMHTCIQIYMYTNSLSLSHAHTHTHIGGACGEHHGHEGGQDHQADAAGVEHLPGQLHAAQKRLQAAVQAGTADVCMDTSMYVCMYVCMYVHLSLYI